jgi:hypothetical protein
MKPEGLINISSKSYSSELAEFLNNFEGKTGLCYLRGRRRIGKSTLLKEMQARLPLFYFSGKLDESTSACVHRFATEWANYSQNTLLKKIKSADLNWELIFDEIAKYAKTKKVMLTFDEIQWLAKSKSGFIGTIKNQWPEFESTKNIRLVICGSSNKFFKDFTGGEEQILRGLKTRSDIIVQPFTIAEVHQHYFPRYKIEEVLFLYMLVGGIPYYLNQFDKELNFIQNINKTLFTKESIFSEEVDEVLRLEFNSAGVRTIKKILATLGITGRVLNEIQKKSKVPVGTLMESLEKLVEYGLAFEFKPVFQKKLEIKRGSKYKIKDFYLNSYFQIIKPHLFEIKKNTENQLLVNQFFNWPQSFYYVENFTGGAFENLIEFILSSSEKRTENIFKKLNLRNINYEIETHWDSQKQIDLVLSETDDKQLRFIECKWTSSVELIKTVIKDLPQKAKLCPLDETPPLLAVAVPIKGTKTLLEYAKKYNVILITQEDLF